MAIFIMETVEESFGYDDVRARKKKKQGDERANL